MRKSNGWLIFDYEYSFSIFYIIIGYNLYIETFQIINSIYCYKLYIKNAAYDRISNYDNDYYENTRRSDNSYIKNYELSQFSKDIITINEFNIILNSILNNKYGYKVCIIK